MDVLIASYGSSDSDSDMLPPKEENRQAPEPLPPPPLPLLSPPNFLGELNYLPNASSGRVRSFPHVEGNYALHVFMPVYIPSSPKKELAQFLKNVSSLVPGLHVVDVDIPLSILCKDDNKLKQVALDREFHISLGRTVPIRVNQIDSVVTMLRQKLQLQRYWIEFNKWEVFVNDDQTRTFLSLEVIAEGLAEITRQIQAVNGVYRLHNLPEFYEDPRPHISLVWALGNISDSLKRAIEDMKRHINVGGSVQKHIFTFKFNGIVCKIGSKTYKLCKFSKD